MPSKEGKKNRKYGRNSGSATMIAYRAEQRVFKNRLKRIDHNIQVQPCNLQLTTARARIDWTPR